MQYRNLNTSFTRHPGFSARGNAPQRGFIIVELLIVIVVIGILAAITIVAYNGVQDRANNATVQQDLKGMATKLQMYYVDNSAYPRRPYGTTTNEAELKPVGSKVSFGSYTNVGNNLLYCSYANGSSARFTLVGKSTSGNVFTIASDSGLASVGKANLVALGTQCPTYAYTTTDPSFTADWGFETGTMKWRAWTGGNGA